jgi:hypothetical protein
LAADIVELFRSIAVLADSMQEISVDLQLRAVVNLLSSLLVPMKDDLTHEGSSSKSPTSASDLGLVSSQTSAFIECLYSQLQMLFWMDALLLQKHCCRRYRFCKSLLSNQKMRLSVSQPSLRIPRQFAISIQAIMHILGCSDDSLNA